MYKIKEDKAEELKDGRTFVYLSKIIGKTTVYISAIFAGYHKCSKTIAISLISIKENIAVNDNKMEEFLKYYFNEE